MELAHRLMAVASIQARLNGGPPGGDQKQVVGQWVKTDRCGTPPLPSPPTDGIGGRLSGPAGLTSCRTGSGGGGRRNQEMAPGDGSMVGLADES